MPIRTVGPDSNGYLYQAVTTAEWGGSYGEQLRAQGYRYCGYGTWGIYVAGPGEPCSRKQSAEPPPPTILPPAPGDQPVAPESPGPTGPVTDGCSSCGHKADPTRPAGAPVAGAPVPAPVVTMPPTEKVRAVAATIPWWAWVLLMLTGAQAVRRG